MKKRIYGPVTSRRQFFKLTGGATLAAAGLGMLPFKKLLGPAAMSEAFADAAAPADLFFAGTDGWITLPVDPPVVSDSLGVTTHPDDLAPGLADGYPDGLTTYIFGFRNVTWLNDTQRAAQKQHAQHNAPMFWLDEIDPASPVDFNMDLTNLGLALRPDLFDAHTIHWHGFRNVIPFFDGEPTGSVAVTTGRRFRYIYRPRDPGTYMFHCHVEDVEHVHMGMTGPVFVRPLQNRTGVGTDASVTPKARTGGGTAGNSPMGYAYNDGVALTDPRSTAYDREFAMFCSEVWGDSHWADSHIQLPEWSDYKADFCLLNGRCYPDTLVPNSPIAAAQSVHSLTTQTTLTGDLLPPAGRDDLRYQPLSALVTCNDGERVLLRFANLGFKESAMTLAGIRMKVVGKDATPMRGRDGTDTSYEATTVTFGAGESIDALFTAPAFSGGSGSSGNGYDTYLLYDRAYERVNNLGNTGGTPFRGRMTEIRVYPLGGVSAQQFPNHNPLVDTVV